MSGDRYSSVRKSHGLEEWKRTEDYGTDSRKYFHVEQPHETNISTLGAEMLALVEGNGKLNVRPGKIRT